MKRACLILSFIFSFLCYDFAHAESIIGGSVEVERNPEGIIIVFTPDSSEHASVIYTRFISGISSGRSELRLVRPLQTTIVMRIDPDNNLISVRLGARTYLCGGARNSTLCSGARALLDLWVLRLGVERRINEAMQLPVFDFEPYMPPEE